MTTQVNTVIVNKSPMVTTTVIPESWSICLKKGDETSWMSVSEACHGAVVEGEEYAITYQEGRISGGFYATGIDF